MGDLDEEFARRGGSSEARRWYRWQAMRTAATAWRSRLSITGERTGGGGRRLTARGDMGDAVAELITGARSLSRRPGLAVGTVLTIALGIAATTTIYSVVDGVVLRPLPYDDPSTLVAIGAMAPGASADPETGLQDLSWVSFPALHALYAGARSFETVGAMGSYWFQESDENGVQVLIRAATVSEEVFAMLGVAPVLGRMFTPDELVFTGGLRVPVVILSHGYWQRRYGGDPGVLGRTLEAAATVNGVRPTIVGVLPESFEPPESFFPSGQLPEIYGPLALPWTEDPTAPRRTSVYVHGLGRLAPGATVAEARAEAARTSRELGTSTAATPLPGTTAGQPMGVNGLHADTLGTAARPLWAFLAAAGLLLILTSLNAATLLLARALDRGHELSVRVALGAGRGRVVRLLLGEAGLLAVVGGAIGVLLAYAGVGAFLRFAPPDLPRLGAVAVDVRVLAVALAATIVTGIAAGLVPALGFLRGSAWEGLQAGARAVSDPASRARTVLVGAQLALAMVLLCGAGLFFASFMRIRSAHPGFEPGGLIVMSEGPTAGGRIDAGTFYRRWDPVLAAQAAVPGVLSVAGASNVPFQTPTWAPRILLPGDEPEVVREGIVGYAITPGYVETMGIDLVMGRAFGAEDGREAERVVLVNEAFVRTQLGGADALGVMVTRDFEVGDVVRRPISMRIIGVVADVVQTRVEDEPHPVVYLPYTQAPAYPLTQWWPVVRTSRAAEEVIPELRASLTGTQFTPENVSTMAGRVGVAQITPRFQSMLIGTFALVALLLAAAGLHGSLAHTVRRRQRELGVRMALGADRSSVLRMVMGQGMRISVIGLALGLLGSMALSRVLASFLFDMQPWDPPTLLGMAVILLLVCAAACLAPARRATRVDPMKVLQAE
jgi:putative ABC transport system permease protein